MYFILKTKYTLIVKFVPGQLRGNNSALGLKTWNKNGSTDHRAINEFLLFNLK
jgi:hypothetical protein